MTRHDPDKYVTDALKAHVCWALSKTSDLSPDAITVQYFPPIELGIPGAVLARTIRRALADLTASGRIVRCAGGTYMLPRHARAI